MLKALFVSTFAVTGALSTAAFANGDVAAGESQYRSCKACHAIANGNEVIVRGGRTGPNLFGIIGRTAGTVEGFRYGDDTLAAGAAGLVWTEENLAEYVADPTGFLRAYLDDPSARSKMSFKLRSGGEEIAAYLASLSPMEDESDDTEESEESSEGS